MLTLLFLLVLPAVYGYIEHIPAIVDQQWNTMNRSGPGYVISEADWSSFYQRWQTSPITPGALNVNEDDYAEGFFDEFGRTIAEIQAYFRILDLHEASFLFLTEVDMALIHSRCDEDWDGFLNETEFRAGYAGLLRPIPWAVMFVTYDTDGSEEMTRREAGVMFDDWGAYDDGNVTQIEYNYFWTTYGYGDAASADRAFVSLDFDADSVISAGDVDTLYTLFDENANNRFDFDEFTEIDFMINGWPRKGAAAAVHY